MTHLFSIIAIVGLTSISAFADKYSFEVRQKAKFSLQSQTSEQEIKLKANLDVSKVDEFLLIKVETTLYEVKGNSQWNQLKLKMFKGATLKINTKNFQVQVYSNDKLLLAADGLTELSNQRHKLNSISDVAKVIICGKVLDSIPIFQANKLVEGQIVKGKVKKSSMSKENTFDSTWSWNDFLCTSSVKDKVSLVSNFSSINVVKENKSFNNVLTWSALASFSKGEFIPTEFKGTKSSVCAYEKGMSIEKTSVNLKKIIERLPDSKLEKLPDSK